MDNKVLILDMRPSLAAKLDDRSWEELPMGTGMERSVPEPRAYHAAAAISSIMYVYGGVLEGMYVCMYICVRCMNLRCGMRLRLSRASCMCMEEC
jgi:hypothetical protein